jgi:hypothetical protein
VRNAYKIKLRKTQEKRLHGRCPEKILLTLILEKLGTELNFSSIEYNSLHCQHENGLSGPVEGGNVFTVSLYTYLKESIPINEIEI